MTKEEVLKTLEEIKTLDTLIDFSKGIQQYKVIITIGYENKTTLEKLSQKLSIDKKKLYNILYKLKRKRLIEATSRSEYCLTILGLDIYRKLATLSLAKKPYRTLQTPLSDIAKDVLLIVGATFSQKITYTELCKTLKMNINDIKYILKPYLTGNTALFKTQGNYIQLTKKGQKAFQKLVKKIGLGTLTVKILSKIGHHKHPLRAIENLFKIYTILTTIVILLVTTPPLFIPLASLLLFFSLIISTLTILKI